MKVAFLLPTHNKKRFMGVFINSIKNLKGLEKDIEFCINFQPPWTKKDIEVAVNFIESLNFTVKHTFNKYKCDRDGLIPFNKIRYDCSPLSKESDIFMLCDDDFEFLTNSDLMIKDIINKFMENENIGVIQCKREPAFIPFAYKEVLANYHNYYTGNGFFFRNISDKFNNILVFPSDAINNLGACEEFIIGYTLASKGYKTIFRTRSNILHHREINKDGSTKYKWGSEDVLFSEKGNGTYINKNFAEVIKR